MTEIFKNNHNENMDNIVYYPIMDKRERCYNIINQIQERLKYAIESGNDPLFTNDISKANAILVWWWDWFMLDVIRKYHQHWLPFIWVNCGTLGFLLNQISDISQLPDKFETFDIIKESFIKVNITTNNWELLERNCINDIVIWWNLMGFYKFIIESEEINEKIQWCGVLLTSPIWSTAYWANQWHSILPLEWQLRWISWIISLPFRFKVICPQEINIKIEWRQKITIRVDWEWWRIDDIKEVNILPSDKTVNICFLKTEHFKQKRHKIFQEKQTGN